MDAKIFEQGQILTADDVNKYLVNDDIDTEKMRGDLTALKTRIQELIQEKQTELSENVPNAIVFHLPKNAYPFHMVRNKMEASGKTWNGLTNFTASITFPENMRIKDVIPIDTVLNGVTYKRNTISFKITVGYPRSNTNFDFSQELLVILERN
ncbi:hypothetical protein [Mobiluncus curtisii]|uniref:Uncharacterized protein n=2 Tax=Mobiluncus curtisii TaxID=2051 RepID=D6ZGG3_MOBCV|nr:hypothetical protein [Mobiluncus curtisii]ADI67721.1 hypothetical protein HMPREF0573_11402 [Mobiluncus curtisii ATCC 43063]QQU08575.1 hypothetical protein I6I85_09175 [Mobiluncus curtisii]QQU08594.1 hypothetical protein I6I85_09300 [Mobiluncus curtisii]SQB64840.1 Uncharacterised protein [Mobiluncus curtisii]SQC02302.1 Uncharacterised protein [Mobiluncus curtisii]